MVVLDPKIQSYRSQNTVDLLIEYFTLCLGVLIVRFAVDLLIFEMTEN